MRPSAVRPFAAVVLLLLTALPAQAQETIREPDPPATALLRALTRLSAGDAPGAVTLLQGALASTPDDPALLTALADATAQTGDRTGARLYAERAVEAAPAVAAPARTLARLLLAGGDAPGARRVLDALLARTPTASDARLDAARLALEGGDKAGARALLAPLLERAPAPDVLDLALEATPATDPARAALVAQALALAPDRTDLYQTLAPAPTAGPIGVASSDGREAFAAGRFADAERQLAAAVNADASDPVRWRFAIMAALEAGHAEAAVRLADDARLIFSGDAGLAIAAAYAAQARRAPGVASLVEAAEAGLRDTPDARVAAALALLRRVLTGARPDATALAQDALAPLPGGALAAALARQ